MDTGKPKVVHCKREAYDVYVGRGYCPNTGKYYGWGNPYTVPSFGRPGAIESYKKYLQNNPALIEKAKRELKGKRLGCWCSPNPCHGDILLEIANS